MINQLLQQIINDTSALVLKSMTHIKPNQKKNFLILAVLLKRQITILKSLKQSHLIQFISEVKVTLKKMEHKVVQYFNQYEDFFNSNHIYCWKYEELSDEIMNSINSSDYDLTLYLSQYETNKGRVKFDGGCLKQDPA